VNLRAVRQYLNKLVKEGFLFSKKEGVYSFYKFVLSKKRTGELNELMLDIRQKFKGVKGINQKISTNARHTPRAESETCCLQDWGRIVGRNETKSLVNVKNSHEVIV